MRKRAICLLVSLALSSVSCGGGAGKTTFDFNDGSLGWVAGFTDFPVDREPDIEFQGGIEPLPAPLGSDRKGFLLSGFNLSDDLFLFINKKIKGLKPDTDYSVHITVAFATSFDPFSGSNWLVKVGATTIEPERIVTEDGPGGPPYYRLNIDKGDQRNSGKDAVFIGDMGDSRSSDGKTWVIKELSNDAGSLNIHTDDTGKAWILAGMEMAWEIKSGIQFTGVSASFREQ